MSRRPIGWTSAWLLSVALLATASWVAAPRVVRHLAHVEPLLFEASPVVELTAAGGKALRLDLEASPWSHRFVEIREGDVALRRVDDPAEVRRAGTGTFHTGTFHSNSRRVLFATTDGTDPQQTGTRIVLRRPRELSAATERALAISFVFLQLLLLGLVGLGLGHASRASPGAAFRAARPALYVLLFAAALGGVLAVVQPVLPASTADVLGEKLNQYRDLEAEVDTVFLGSSKIYRHLDPLTFEQALAKHGESAYAFNLGIPDMRMLEVLYFARHLFERSGGALRRLVVECQPDPLFEREENVDTERFRRWHDLTTLGRIAPEILRVERSWPGRLVLLGERLEAFSYRASLIGRGTDALASLLREQPRWIDPERRGFLALDEDLAAPVREIDRLDLERRFSELHDQVPDWQQRMARLRRSNPGGELTDPFEIELFRELQELADRHRVELVFLISPDPVRRPNLVYAHETGVIDRLIRFDDPERYADFYQLDSRFDRFHLDAEAARRMTRLFAERLLEPER